MNERRLWLGIFGGSGALVLALGGLIYMEQGRIDKAREEVALLRTEIGSSRKLIEGTPALEREVIVLREVSEVIKGILPDTAAVNNLVHTFQDFSSQSKVRIRSLKPRAANRGKAAKGAFEEVAYTLTLEADAFEFLDFMDLIESHSRFMRVPMFKVNAASRTQVEADGIAAHKMQLDVETFVYEPGRDAKPVKIEGYDRKRDVMVGEINRRRQDLVVASYDYPGARGRRDPWVDPRVPVEGDSDTALSVQEQMEVVQTLYERTQATQAKHTEVKAAQNVIEEMMARAELEEMLALLEEDVRRVLAEGAIRYVPSERRLQLEVVDVLLAMRRQLNSTEGGRGPSIEKLREIAEAMIRHMQREEFALMLDAYRLVDEQLGFVDGDALRKPLVDELRRLAMVARTVLEFEDIQLDVGGVAIMAGAPSAALINGSSVGVGDLVGGELLVRDIRVDEIEFIFRGVVLARRIGSPE